MDMDRMAEELFDCMVVFQRGPVKQMQGISRGEMAMLGYFIMNEPEATPTELSQFFNLSTARVANTLNSLERKKLIVREHDSADRRKVLVHITPLGRQIAEEKHNKALHCMGELLTDLGEHDAAELLRIFQRIRVRMEQKEAEAAQNE